MLNDTHVIQLKSHKQQISMTVAEAARWLALIEGVNVIHDRAERLRWPERKLNSLLKPCALNKYIKDRYFSAVSEILIAAKL